MDKSNRLQNRKRKNVRKGKKNKLENKNQLTQRNNMEQYNLKDSNIDPKNPGFKIPRLIDEDDICCDFHQYSDDKNIISRKAKITKLRNSLKKKKYAENPSNNLLENFEELNHNANLFNKKFCAENLEEVSPIINSSILHNIPNINDDLGCNKKSHTHQKISQNEKHSNLSPHLLNFNFSRNSLKHHALIDMISTDATFLNSLNSLMKKKEKEILQKKRISSLLGNLNLYIRYMASKKSLIKNEKGNLNKQISTINKLGNSFWCDYSDQYFYLEDLIDLDILLLQNLATSDLSILKM